jgi:orotidine-5'-phosphate decarboxylase
MTPIDLQLRAVWARTDSLLCVGLDPDPARFPAPLAGDADATFRFCRDIVDATHDLVCAYKPQIAYFAAVGAERALERVIAHIRTVAPGLPVILDAKRGDIGPTAQQYAREAFERYGADAVTVNPYLGFDTLEPFVERGSAFVLCRTSNPGSADLQRLDVGGRPLAHHVATEVQRRWGASQRVGLVVGATYPAELGAVRAVAPDLPFLVPGIGAQGGDVALVATAMTDAGGVVVNSSRAVLYASAGDDFATGARVAAQRARADLAAAWSAAMAPDSGGPAGSAR